MKQMDQNNKIPNEFMKKQATATKKMTPKKLTMWQTRSGSSIALGKNITFTRSLLHFTSDALSRHLISSVLDVGSYGIVKAAMDSMTLRRLAVKVFSKERINRIPKGMESVMNELLIARGLHHENIQKVYDVVRRDGDWFMTTELCKCNVEELLTKTPNERLSDSLSHFLFVQLMNGLEYLHAKGVVHMDVKPDNLMISFDNKLKIIDFGVAKKLDMFADDTCHEFKGCPSIASPEVARGDKAFSGFKLDIWTCGVALYRMLTGNWPYQAMNAYLLAEKIINEKYEIPDYIGPKATFLLNQLLEYEAINRPSIKDIRKIEWVATGPSIVILEREMSLLDKIEDKHPLKELLQRFKNDSLQRDDSDLANAEHLLGVYE